MQLNKVLARKPRSTTSLMKIDPQVGLQTKQGMMKKTHTLLGLKGIYGWRISGETAYNTDPYPSGKMGVSLTSVEKLKRAVKMARDNKLQLAVHAMGDKAIQTVIDVTKEMEPWLTTMPSVRIEHASLMTDQMFARDCQ